MNARSQALPHLQYHAGQYSCFYIWHDPLVNNCPLVVGFDPSIASVKEVPDYAIAGFIINS